MPENPYNGNNPEMNNDSVNTDQSGDSGLRYNDDSLNAINKVEEYSVDTSEQSYIDGNPQKIHFDNPNWNVPPENQSYTDAFAMIIGGISIAVVIIVIFLILKFLRVI